MSNKGDPEAPSNAPLPSDPEGKHGHDPEHGEEFHSARETEPPTTHEGESSAPSPDSKDEAEADPEAPPPLEMNSSPGAESGTESTDGDPNETNEPTPATETPKKDEAKCEYSSVRVTLLENLPPLPEPKHNVLSGENRTGICVVTTGVALCLFFTHYIALTLVLPSAPSESSSLDGSTGTGDIAIDGDDDPYRVSRSILLALIYSEAVVALVCLVGVLRVDPCVVQRSVETCNPLPRSVESWVLTGGANGRLPTERYIRDPDRGLYCTRCLVWRDQPSDGSKVVYYHCATCQRCCAYHDHHCNVFGRCIAGNKSFWEGNAGNLVYFYGVLGSGVWAYCTVFAALIYAFGARYGTQYAIPIGLVTLLVFPCCCTGGSVLLGIMCWPCCRLWGMTKRWCFRRR